MATAKTRVDIQNQNFNLFFESNLGNISPSAKEQLPKDLSFKLFRNGGKANSESTCKLNFLTKLYLLVKSLKKTWYIVVMDEQNGLSPEEFGRLHEAVIAKKKADQEYAEELTNGTFVTGSKELIETLAYLNGISNSPMYTYLKRSKEGLKGHKTAAEAYKYRQQSILKFLVAYEGTKKKWVADLQVSIPEWLVLIYLYDGKEKEGAVLYKETFKHCYQSNSGKIKLAFGTLQHRGFITKRGVTRMAKFTITAAGREAVDRIMTNYVSKNFKFS